jgi:hypothetical protein
VYLSRLGRYVAITVRVTPVLKWILEYVVEDVDWIKVSHDRHMLMILPVRFTGRNLLRVKVLQNFTLCLVLFVGSLYVAEVFKDTFRATNKQVNPLIKKLN